MHRSGYAVVPVLVALVLTAAGASAQNMLVNPDFDNDLSGWDGPAMWDPADAYGSDSSGSATWINDYAAGGSTIVRQCVNFTQWIEGFDLAAFAFIPSGQPGEGYTYLTVAFYSDSDCGTYMTGRGSQSFSDFDNWVLVHLTGWTPSGAASVQIAAANQKTAPGDFQTYCDAFFFAANPEMVFADGFETADTSEWSADTGGLV